MNEALENKARIIMGWTAILFVPLSIAVYLLFGVEVEGFDPFISFSTLYWTNARTIYIAGFVTVILYFAIFNGNSTLERILSRSFIVCAVIHLLCPLQDADILSQNFPTMFNPIPGQNLKAAYFFHHLSSYLIPIILGAYVLHIFVKRGDGISEQQKKRNRYYYTATISCAVITLICVINLLTYDFNIIMIAEMLCFFLLGSCWVVEGGGVKALRD